MNRCIFIIVLLFSLFTGTAHADYIGAWKIDDPLTFTVCTESSANVSADADSVPSYRVYEDETGTAILTGSMAKLDDANTLGFYSEQITLSAANGFEKGKSYSVYISYAVSAVARTVKHEFQVEAETHVNSIGTSAADTIALRTVARMRGYSNVLCVGSAETHTTIASAKAAATAGDLIVVFPGSYTVTAEIGKEGVDYYFCSNAVVTANIDTGSSIGLFVDSATGDGFGNVFGHGQFLLANATAPSFISATGGIGTPWVCNIEADRIYSSTSTTNVYFNVANGGTTFVFDVWDLGANSTSSLVIDDGDQVLLKFGRINTAGPIATLTTSGDIKLVGGLAKTTGTTILSQSAGSISVDCRLASTNASAVGLSPVGGQLYLVSGALYTPSGRPSLAGSSAIYVTSAFAYNKSASTATGVVVTTPESISARLPSALDSDGLLKANIKSVNDSTADAGLWKTYIEQLGQVRYRLGLDGTSSVPTTARPHLEQRYVRP